MGQQVLRHALADLASRIHGPRGFVRESTAERLYRDARAYLIGSGTREIVNEITVTKEG